MVLISHRGNIDGKNLKLENNPEYLDYAMELGFDVELDIWYIGRDFYLGHDTPQYKIDVSWLKSRIHKIWVHCKNIEALQVFYQNSDIKFNYFWHEEDTLTLTSKGYIWAYPGKQPISGSIAVMPEIYADPLDSCLGVCSDFIKKYI